MKRKFSALIVLIIIGVAAFYATSQPIGGPVGIPRVTHDTSLSGSGTPASPLAVNTTNIQSRVTGTCTNPNSIRVIDSAGTVTCSTGVIDTNGAGLTKSFSTLAVGAGSGILASGTVTAVNLGAGMQFSSGAVVPNLAGASCAAGSAVTAIDASGTGTCTNVSTISGVGDITGVTAGSGLTGGGTSGAVTLDVGCGAGLLCAADTITLDFATGNVVQTSTSTGTLNDFSLNATTTVLVFTNAAGATINGITGGADGRVLKIINNTGSANLIFVNEAGASAAANRFATVASSNWTGSINSVTSLVYRGTQARWVLVKDYVFPQIDVTTNANITGNINAAAGNLTITDITSTGNTQLGNNSSDTLTVPSALAQQGNATFSGTATFNGTMSTTADTNIGNGAGDDLTVLGDTASFNTTTISLGTSSTNDTVNIGGNTDTDVAFVNGPRGINRYEGLHFDATEEFNFSSDFNNDQNVGSIGLGYYTTNGTPLAEICTTCTGRFGAWALDTNLSSSTSAVRFNTGFIIDLGSTTTVSAYLTSRFDTLSSSSNSIASMYVARWGLTDTGFSDTSGDVTNGIYFMYDKGNTATGGPNGSNLDRYSCWSANAGTRTKYLLNGTGNSDESFALGTVTPVAATWMRLRIKITTTAGTPTRAEFYTVASGGTETKVCNINTNLPAASTVLRWDITLLPKATTGTGSRQWQLDQFNHSYDAAAQRNP